MGFMAREELQGEEPGRRDGACSRTQVHRVGAAQEEKMGLIQGAET